MAKRQNPAVQERIARVLMLDQKPDQPPGFAVEQAWQVARRNHVGLAWALQDPAGLACQPPELEKLQAFQNALQATSLLFEAAGIPHLYIKFRKHYPYYDTNIDVIVGQRRWQEAISILEKAGYRGHVMFKEPDKIMFSKPGNQVSVHLHPGVTWNGVPYFKEQELWENSRPSGDFAAREMSDLYDFMINLGHNVFENYEISLGDTLYFLRHLNRFPPQYQEMDRIAAGNGWQFGFRQIYRFVVELAQAWEQAGSSGQVAAGLLAYPYPIPLAMLARSFAGRIASNFSGRQYGSAFREIIAYPSFYLLKRRHELPFLRR